MSFFRRLSTLSAKTSNRVENPLRIHDGPPKIREPSIPRDDKDLPRVNKHPRKPIPGADKDLPKIYEHSPLSATSQLPEDDVLDEKKEVLREDGIRRDPSFYYVPLIILVEGTLFKIPRTYFEMSEVFRNTHLCPSKDKNPLEGLTDEHPLRLDGVCASEFGCLITAIIQMDLEEDTEMSLTQWTAVLKLALIWEMKPIEDWAISKIPIQIQEQYEWTSALKLSTQLKIQGLRKIAIQALTVELSPLQKFELAVECSVDTWLFEGYSMFVNRDEGLSDEDVEKLGWERTSNLFRVRNRRFEHHGAHGPPLESQEPPDWSHWSTPRASSPISSPETVDCESGQRYNVESDIRTTFASEFAAIAAFDNSTWVPYLRSDLKTVADSGATGRDRTCYFVDIIFLVEDTLFKVPHYLFGRSSNVFRDMFQLPVAEGVVLDGATEEQPLRLEGIQKEDFRQLLQAMKCPTSKSLVSKGSNAAEGHAPMHWKEWVSVLRLSCMWQMDRLQQKATKEILDSEHQSNKDVLKVLLTLATELEIPDLRDPVIQKLYPILQPIEMAELGTAFRVPTWLLQGYLALVQKRGGITVEDEKRLGPETTLRLFRVREHLFQSMNNSAEDAIREIMRVFSKELTEAGWDDK